MRASASSHADGAGPSNEGEGLGEAEGANLSNSPSLRKAKLVHRLQRERGATCAWVAGSGAAPFDTLIVEQRARLDEIRIAKHLQDELLGIRTDAGEFVKRALAGQISEGSDATTFWSIFARYNKLIKVVLQSAASAVALSDPDAPAMVERHSSNSDSAERLFDSFMRLKEATGVERAFLCGVLSLPPAALPHLPSRAFAEFVMGMQHQEFHQERVCEGSPPSLLKRIRQGVAYAQPPSSTHRPQPTITSPRTDPATISTAPGRYAPELKAIQAKLSAEFDVLHLRESLTATHCWELFTVYIDQLEGLERLLYTEHKEQRRRDVEEGLAGGVVREVLALLSPATDRDAAAASGTEMTPAPRSAPSAEQFQATLEALFALPAEELKREMGRQLARAAGAASGVSALARVPQPWSASLLSNERDHHARRKAAAADGAGGASGQPPAKMARRYSFEEWCDGIPREYRVGLDSLALQRRIGGGSGGIMYLAIYQGSAVALKLACGSSGLDAWRRETLAFAQLHHPNVVRCMGLVVETPSYGMVLEYCEYGDMCSVQRQGTPPGFILRTALGVAAGMLHLHLQGVLHRDLKGVNVLIGSGGEAKVTDFGLSTRAPDDTNAGGWLTAETGTYRWMAPEVLLHERYSKSADIFSYGGLLFELITHEAPFEDRPSLQAAVAVGMHDERPPLPAGTPARLAAIVNACWQKETMARPTFREVHGMLLTLMAEGLTPAERLWLDAPHGHSVYRRRLQALPAAAPAPLLLPAHLLPQQSLPPPTTTLPTTTLHASPAVAAPAPTAMPPPPLPGGGNGDLKRALQVVAQDVQAGQGSRVAPPDAWMFAS